MKKLLLVIVVAVFIMGCGLMLGGPGGASTFYHPNDYQWVKTSDGRIIPVKKGDGK